jgi:hypothetical protein
MEPNRIGRALGIGARVAGAKLREQADRLGQAPIQPTAGSLGGSAPTQEAAARVAAGVAQAARNFRTAQASAGSARAAGSGGTNAATVAEAASAGTRRLAHGAAHFGATFFRPFAHATSLLWKQITGIFFALFALFFLEHTWMVYKAAHWRDRHVFLYGVLALVFTWFAVSTFWRVRGKQRRQP